MNVVRLPLLAALKEELMLVVYAYYFVSYKELHLISNLYQDSHTSRLFVWITSFTCSMNCTSGIDFKSTFVRNRTETASASTSLSPTMSMYGNFCNCASRILDRKSTRLNSSHEWIS